MSLNKLKKLIVIAYIKNNFIKIFQKTKTGPKETKNGTSVRKKKCPINFAYISTYIQNIYKYIFTRK